MQRTILQRLYDGLLGALLSPIALAFVMLAFPYFEIIKSFSKIYRDVVNAYQTGRPGAGLINVLLQLARITVSFVLASLVLLAITSSTLALIVLNSTITSGIVTGFGNGRQPIMRICMSILETFEQRYINDNPVLGILRPIHRLLSRGLDYFEPVIIIPIRNVLNNMRIIMDELGNHDLYGNPIENEPHPVDIHSLNLPEHDFGVLKATQQPRLGSNEIEQLAQSGDADIINRLDQYKALLARLDVDDCPINSDRPSKEDTVLLVKQYFNTQCWVPVSGTSYVFSKASLVRWHQMPEHTNHILLGDNLYEPELYEGFETRYVSHRYYDTPDSDVGISQELSENIDFLRQNLGRQRKPVVTSESVLIVDPDEARRQQMRAARLLRFMPSPQPSVQQEATLNDTNAHSCST